MKEVWKKKEGSALLMAMIIMMIVMMLSLAMLLVSYTLFSTANSQKVLEQCRELAQGVSHQLEKEITGSEVEFATYEKMKEAMDGGENPLWCYLRCNLWQTSWPYYNDEERGHTSAYASRYFKLDTGNETSQQAVDGISVRMYWESEAGAEKGEETNFVIQVTCEKGGQKSTITSNYTLNIEEAPEGYGGEGEQTVDNNSCNPQRNIIQTNEKWSFNLSVRE